jgi:acyl dehydratase
MNSTQPETPPLPRDFGYDQVAENQRESLDYPITPAVYQGFLDTFHDHSPIHVDESHARARGFPGRVMHGSILNGFISHFVGMWFPGRPGLLLSVDLRFANPSYLGDVIRLESVVRQKLDAHRVILLDVTLTNLTRTQLAARGRIQVMIKDNV